MRLKTSGNCSKKPGMPGGPTERHGPGLPWPYDTIFSRSLLVIVIMLRPSCSGKKRPRASS